MLRGILQRHVAKIGFVVLLLYAAWIGWPYLVSIVVRDAAVTTWISIAAAPIGGYTTHSMVAGARIGADGRIATIADDNADMRDLARARAGLIQSEANFAAQQASVDGIRRGIEAREKHATGFASTYGADLDAAISGAKASLTSLRQRLKLAKAEADRLEKVKASGLSSQSAVDAAHASVAELDHQIADATAALARTTKRQSASGSGVYLLEDGSNGNAMFQNLADAKLRLIQAEAQLRQYAAERDAAQAIVDATQRFYDKSRSLDVIVPRDAMVWSLIASPGQAVQPGAPIASWVDCTVLLVDVPVSDVETSLLRVGSPADVVIEGERDARRGRVIVTRGAAGVLDSHDLAAVAKGRHPGIGQAIVKLDATAADIAACAIGHAAYVDFPEVGIFQVMRQRLRL